MKFIHRLGYYLGGFSIGLILLAFFLSGKKTSCDYMPQARTIKNLKSKKFEVSQDAKLDIPLERIDSLFVRELLEYGEIRFRESEPRIKPCGTYTIISDPSENESYLLKLQNCDSLLVITNLTKAR